MQTDVARLFEGMVAGLRDTGLKDAAIAKGAHVSAATICRWGRGDAVAASASGFIRLATFYENRTGQPPNIGFAGRR